MTISSSSAQALERASPVRLMAFDVDGVLTDGSLLYGEHGEAFKRFNTLDGHGLKMLEHAGIRVALVSGRNSVAVARRAAELRIPTVMQGIEDKVAAFTTLLKEQGLEWSQAGFMGDDLPDLPVMRRAQFAASVPGAPDYIRAEAHWVSSAGGGFGAVRECCDLLLRAQGKWTEFALA